VKVFISWSGSLSHSVAKVFKDWLPSVIQAIKPYLSSEDVDKGTRWNIEVAGELEESQIGMIILTRSNMNEPWINFEAGALSKSLEMSRVCPVLLGILPTDVTGPLAQFQATPFGKDEILRLMKTTNKELGDSKLDDIQLEKAFGTFWPDLESQVKQAMEKDGDNGEPIEVRSDREIIEEILNITRSTAMVHQLPPGVPRPITDWWMPFVKSVGLANPLAATMLEEKMAIGYFQDKVCIYFDNPSHVDYLKKSNVQKLVEVLLNAATGTNEKFVPIVGAKLDI